MAEYIITKKSNLVAVADSIRERTGGTGKITLGEMIDDINHAVGGDGIDTSDATASENEILLGETAYVDGEKITGTFTIEEELTTQDDLIAQIQAALEDKAAGVAGEDVTTETNTYTSKLAILETAITDLETELQDKANGGSSGLILNKINMETIDKTSIGAGQTQAIYTYNASKPIASCWIGSMDDSAAGFGGTLPTLQGSDGKEVSLGSVTIKAPCSGQNKSIDIILKTLMGSYVGSINRKIYIIFATEDNNTDCDIFNIKCNNYLCYVRDTQITLADGNTKLVQDIAYDDNLLVWDFDNACYTSAKPLWIKRAETSLHYYHCVFENGLELNLVGSDGNCHAVFCIDDNQFEYATRCIGKMIMTNLGASKLLSCELKHETIEFYNIVTNYHMNCYANGVLTSTKLNNIYPIENMKFIKENREIIPYEVYSEIPAEFYNGFRLGEHKAEDVEWIIQNIKAKLSKML